MLTLDFNSKSLWNLFDTMSPKQQGRESKKWVESSKSRSGLDGKGCWHKSNLLTERYCERWWKQGARKLIKKHLDARCL